MRFLSYFMEQTSILSGKSSLFIPAGCGPHVGHVLTGIGESDYLIFHSAVCEALIIPLNQDSFTALCVRVLITQITPVLAKDLCTQMSNLTSRNLYSWAFLHSSSDQNVPSDTTFWVIKSFQLRVFFSTSWFCFKELKKTEKWWPLQDEYCERWLWPRTTAPHFQLVTRSV